MPLDSHIIHIQPFAPTKPAQGAACNGCGVCCLVEPCPLGMLISRKRRGACDALLWSEAGRLYRCGVVAHPLPWVQQMLPRWCRGLAPAGAWLMGKLALRWIAAGGGCDSSLAPQTAPSGTMRAQDPLRSSSSSTP